MLLLTDLSCRPVLFVLLSLVIPLVTLGYFQLRHDEVLAVFLLLWLFVLAVFPIIRLIFLLKISWACLFLLLLRWVKGVASWDVSGQFALLLTVLFIELNSEAT